MKTAVITGGSRGIGAAMVRAFSGEGRRVAFSYKNSGKDALALANETGAIPFCADMGEERGIEAFYAFAKTQLGHFDALILNAGIAREGLARDAGADDFDALFSVNVRGAFLMARRALPAMTEFGSGAILFISSIWGLRGAACEAAYSASKAALPALAQALAKEAAPCVRVNCIAPGVIDTAMLDCYSEGDKLDLIARTPLGRLGKPEDVARTALFLCGGDADFITGQTLTVDGGFLL